MTGVVRNDRREKRLQASIETICDCVTLKSNQNGKNVKWLGADYMVPLTRD